MSLFDFFNADFNEIFKHFQTNDTWKQQTTKRSEAYETNQEDFINEVVKDLDAQHGKGQMETKEVVLKRTIKTWTSPDGSYSVKFALYEKPTDDKEQETVNKQKTIDRLKNQLANAVSREEFEKAAELRDSIAKLSNSIK
jgi:excinuclease UvrABC helicase subunit UvrB